AELLKVSDGEIENLKAQLLLKEAEAAKAIRLRAEVFKFEAIEKSLQGEVGVLRDHSATLEKEKNELSVKVTDLSASVKVREKEVTDLDAQVTAVRLHNDNLVGSVHELEISFAGLQEQVAMAFHLEDNFYPHLLTTIFGRRWLLTHGMELAIVKCLNSTEYLSALGAAISKAVKKGMQEGLSAGITHGAEGRKLADVAAYDPFAEADYLSALQRLQNVNFSLIAELKSNKDASVDTIMNLLRLDDTLAERKIRENIASHVSALRGVFVSLSEPLSAAALEGTEGTFGSAHDTTTALSVTFVSTCTIPPISTNDYEVAYADGQEGASVDGKTAPDENNNPFSDVSNAELNILE
nr:hypothetical protein [Tanacetum cinerariifolium]